MYKHLLFWATEYLNYFSLIFWGIKLFLKKYEVKINKKEWVENVIIIVASVPVVWLCADNYRFAVYSNFISHILIFYMCLFIVIYTKTKIRKIFALIVIYVYDMRMFDLLIVAVMHEVNRMSRVVELDLIHMGYSRSIFLAILSAGYYVVYYIIMKTKMFEYLQMNIFYQWIFCVYSFLGVLCFCRVYRFEYSDKLIQYWIFYLVGFFIVCGIFMFYFIRVKEEERNRILTIRNDLLEANYQSLRKAYDENQMMYHDFKNHMLAMHQLIEEQRCEEALEYINTYIQWNLRINKRIESGCKIIDIIVNYKISEAIEKSIDLTYEIDFIGKLCMEDIDMCALLANLLNNSVEACEKIEKDKRWINLRIKKQNEMLFIWIENSMKERKIEKDKFFETNKEDKKLHGLGMKSIDNVIKKYDGHKEYEIEKDKFLIYISIPIN